MIAKVWYRRIYWFNIVTDRLIGWMLIIIDWLIDYIKLVIDLRLILTDRLAKDFYWLLDGFWLMDWLKSNIKGLIMIMNDGLLEERLLIADSCRCYTNAAGCCPDAWRWPTPPPTSPPSGGYPRDRWSSTAVRILIHCLCLRTGRSV